MSRFKQGTSDRLRWRVIVQTAGSLDPARSARPMAWHMVECSDPAQPDAHCPEGQQALSVHADPDGHCLIAGVCARCAPTT